MQRLEPGHPVPQVVGLDMANVLLQRLHGQPHLLDLLHQQGAVSHGAGHAGAEAGRTWGGALKYLKRQ